jgi:hypothetical protein
MKIQNPNIETRIANRAKSIFAAFGQTINDFYLEAGIYFVGGFNAALVAWDIYTTLISTGQPLAYAVALAIIAFIAVEGLAVYLVGAAAKTGNGWLWFFSVVFAGFFTYAHYREMSSQGGIIAQYITLAIPPFVVIGYWARVVKIAVESSQVQAAKQEEDEAARLREIQDDKQRRLDNEAAHLKQIEDEKRQYQIEQARLAAEHKRMMEQRTADLVHSEKMARIEAKTKTPDTVKESVKPVKPFTLDDLKQALQAANRPTLTQLAKDFGVSRPTLYNRLNKLVDSGEVVKNGNGYEVAK